MFRKTTAALQGKTVTWNVNEVILKSKRLNLQQFSVLYTKSYTFITQGLHQPTQQLKNMKQTRKHTSLFHKKTREQKQMLSILLCITESKVILWRFYVFKPIQMITLLFLGLLPVQLSLKRVGQYINYQHCTSEWCTLKQFSDLLFNQ